VNKRLSGTSKEGTCAAKGSQNADFIKGARQLGIVPLPPRKEGQNPLRVRLSATHAAGQANFPARCIPR
jgi:hypothetical protein